MDFEHQPTPGPAVWIGAGLLTAIGGASLLWVTNAPSSDAATTIIGSILVVAGLASTAAGVWRKRHRPAPDRPDEGQR